jgi:ribulose bisphosphate carboxylase small subunit
MAEIAPPFAALMRAWNERDLSQIRGHLEHGVAPDVEFVDPNYAIRGIDAFADMVRDFRVRMPNAEVIRTSGIDQHHDRARYSWVVVVDPNHSVIGFDAVALAPDGKVARVDGFFGPLPPV